jgi:hypothetical protein
MFCRIERSGPPGGGPARANTSPGSAIRPMITVFHRDHVLCFALRKFLYQGLQGKLISLARFSHGRQICVNLPARAVSFRVGSVAFPRRVFHTAPPVASPP